MPKRITTREGGVLRWFRERKGLTWEDLARRSGRSRSTIARWEKGILPLDRATLVEVVSFLGVPPEAVDAALFADDLANPPGEPGRLPAPPGCRLVEGAVAAGGSAAVKAARAELYADLRRQQAPAARQWAKERWAILKKLPAKEQDLAVEVLLGDERSWALVVRICLASQASAADRADVALQRARLAVRLAEHDPWEEPWRLLLLGWAEPFLANAHRVGGDLPAAAETFACADQHWCQGEGGDPTGLLNASRRLDLKATLLPYEGDFEGALVLLDQALAGAQTNHARGRLLIMRSTTLKMAGDYESSFATLRQAEPLVDARQDPRLPWAILFNRADLYCHLDCYQDAAGLLPQVETMAAELGTELDGWRLLWLKGRTWAGLGQVEPAIVALRKVRQHFLSKGIAYDYVLVSTELGTLHLERGETQRVKEIADEMMWIFQGQKVHQEALAALALFCHAAKQEEAEVDWTRRLVKYLYRAQHNPKLRFEG